MAVQYILRVSWIVYTENQSFLMYSVVTKLFVLLIWRVMSEFV